MVSKKISGTGKMQAEDNMERTCPIHKTMDFIGKRWTLMILLELYRGKAKWKRYSEVKRGLKGITPKILSMRMKELVKEGLVRKKVDARTFPVKSEYSLTDRGEDFVKIIKEIKAWGLKWKVRNEVCQSVECQQCEF
jgi:DNA-binding HxlR family transcriptional regulator